MRFHKIFIFPLLSILPSIAFAVSPGEVRFNNEASDTTLITDVLTSVHNERHHSPQENIIAVAEKLLDVPYQSGTIDELPERLTVNLSAMDCTTFVENVLALVLTLEENRTSWHDFVYNLERIRYRNGTLNGYASRLHYVSDWIIDNSHRGILIEMTDRIADPSHQIKTLDFMSRNRDKYPALADDEEFQRLQDAEIGFRSHRIPFIKPTAVDGILLQDGDIVAFTTKTPGLDVQHVGFIKMVDGKPHLLHASSTHKKVIVDPLSLSDYLKRNRSITGIRVIRLREQ